MPGLHFPALYSENQLRGYRFSAKQTVMQVSRLVPVVLIVSLSFGFVTNSFGVGETRRLQEESRRAAERAKAEARARDDALRQADAPAKARQEAEARASFAAGAVKAARENAMPGTPAGSELRPQPRGEPKTRAESEARLRADAQAHEEARAKAATDVSRLLEQSQRA